MAEEMKIVQIIPAEGWFAECKWKQEDGSVWTSREPVACFALVEDEEGGRDVEPMIFCGTPYAESIRNIDPESIGIKRIDLAIGETLEGSVGRSLPQPGP